MRHARSTHGRSAAVLLVLGLFAAAGLAWRFADPEPDTRAPRVVEVRMLDDGGDYRFEPERVEVRRGDTVRFVQAGTLPHNVEFVRNTAPATVDLGDLWVGDYLTRAGESYDVVIDDRFEDGEYEYICTPHAPMGMNGTIVVRGDANAIDAAQPAPPGDATATADRSAESAAGDRTGALPVVRGRDGARPAPYEIDGDVKVFRLTVERIEWETTDGKRVEAWTFNRQVPGPTIRVQEGDRVRLIVENALPQATTTHWHGLEVPNAMDGVPGISQDPIEPGESFVYEFTASPSGTHLYHSHHNALHQEGHGLYGMFIVEPPTEPASLRSDREELLILADGPLGFVINGKEFPSIKPIEVRRGERIRVRMANLGGLYHPMHLHGGSFTVVAKDGFPLPTPQRMNTISLAPGETFDVILEAQEPGTWLWHCHVLSHVTGARDEDGIAAVSGMVTTVEVAADEPVHADPEAR